MRNDVTMTEAADVAGGFTHPALFYRSWQEYLDATVPFVEEGLSAGEPVAVAVPEPNLRRLRTELGAAADRVQFTDMARAGRNPGRIIPGVLRAFADTHPDGRVRIVGEPLWPGRSGMEYPACAQHEALINRAFSGRPAIILCPYDATRLDPVALADAAATHPVLVDDGGWQRSHDYEPDHVIASYNRPLPEPPDGAATLTVSRRVLAYARDFTAQHAWEAGLSGVRVEDAMLVVTELTANSIAHGGGSGTLHLWGYHGSLVCQVSDAGRIHDPLAGRRRTAPAQAGGHGLLVVNLLADLVRTHTGADGTTTRVYLR